MSYAHVLLYLALKHLWLTHGWDVGYSAARRPAQRGWWRYHLRQVGVELGTSLLLYSYIHTQLWVSGLVLETFGLTVGLVIERLATYRTMLAMHLVGELAMLGLYFLLAWGVVYL